MSLKIKQLKVNIETREVIKEASFEIKAGEIVTLSGPNGSGKTTLAEALAGSPKLLVSGTIILDGIDISTFPPEKRAAAGLFLAFQNPVELPNITVTSFLKAAYWAVTRGASIDDFATNLEKYLHFLKLSPAVLDKTMNADFSGGEKKRLEALQMLLLKPKYVILDEIDSGVDKESQLLVEAAIKLLWKENKTGFLIISHYQKFLEQFEVTKTLTLADGTLV